MLTTANLPSVVQLPGSDGDPGRTGWVPEGFKNAKPRRIWGCLQEGGRAGVEVNEWLAERVR